MKRTLTVKNILDKKYKELTVDGIWLAAIGQPEACGTWFVYGASKNGKTSFTMMLTKYLTKFGRVYYNSFEEKAKKSIQNAVRRAGMPVTGSKWVMPPGGSEKFEIMVERLKKNKSPNIVVIDSVQFARLKFKDYQYLKETFPDKIFIYVSHVQGNLPQREVAQDIYKDADVSFRVEGFIAYPTSRYGGDGEPIVIDEERAMKYSGK